MLQCHAVDFVYVSFYSRLSPHKKKEVGEIKKEGKPFIDRQKNDMRK